MEVAVEHIKGYKKTKLGWIPEDWDYSEFKNFVERCSEKYDSKKSSANYPCIELEHINQVTGSINGFVDSKTQKSTKNRFVKGQVLFGKLRPYLKKYWFAEYEGVCSSEIWVLKAKNQKTTNKFIFYFIQQHRFIQTANVTSGSKMPRADWDFISNYPFVFPPVLEQKAIADCLSRWDKAIQDISELIEQKELQKKGLMQQLLTGKTRLKGYDGEWQEDRLGNYFSERRETGFDKLELLSIGESGVYPQSNSNKKDTSNSDKSKYKRICIGDIGYNTMRMWQGRSALSILEGIVSPAYTIVKPLENADSLFFSYLFKLEVMVHKFYRNSQGMVSDTLMCKFKDFKIVKFMAPPKREEQSAIANVLLNADKEIELLNQKREQLKKQKKGLMQQLLTGKKRLKILNKNIMGRKERHVVPNKDGGWDSKRENAKRASKHFDKKEDAMKWSREMAKKEGSELIPHKRDGKIQNPNSYGNDPNPPKDKKY